MPNAYTKQNPISVSTILHTTSNLNISQQSRSVCGLLKYTTQEITCTDRAVDHQENSVSCQRSVDDWPSLSSMSLQLLHVIFTTTSNLNNHLITRGDDLRLQKNHTRYDLRKFFFTNTIVNMSNSLPNSVVHAKSTDVFKKQLDKF